MIYGINYSYWYKWKKEGKESQHFLTWEFHSNCTMRYYKTTLTEYLVITVAVENLLIGVKISGYQSEEWQGIYSVRVPRIYFEYKEKMRTGNQHLT